DAERGVAVAYDARTYELAGDSWSPRASAKLPHTGGALAYDVSRAGSVYFGGVIAFGEYSDQTWLWDGAAWEPLAALTSPPARTRAAMAYDERRETLVLFGGATIVQGRQSHAFDTWELRDTTWSEVTASGPTPRDTPSMTYDQGRRRVVLWAAQSERDSRLWEFDGKRWFGEEPPPIAGAAGVVGYDTREQRLLLHDNAGRTWARASGAAPGDETPTPPEHEPDEPAPADTDAGTGDDQDGGASTGTGGRRGSDGGCVLVVAEPARGSLWSLVGALSVLGWRRRRARIAQLHR
ncbi:MAG TPA: hypothetical protein VFZ61_02510, partial [Polyangiales bacterium]